MRSPHWNEPGGGEGHDWIDVSCPAAAAAQRDVAMTPSQPHTGSIEASAHDVGRAVQRPTRWPEPQYRSTYAQ